MRIETDQFPRNGTQTAEFSANGTETVQFRADDDTNERRGAGPRWAGRLLAVLRWAAAAAGPDSVQVEAVQVHDLRPGGGEVLHELLGAVRAGVDLGDRPQLRVRAEHQVDGGGRPLDLAAVAVLALVDLGRGAVDVGRGRPLG